MKKLFILWLMILLPKSGWLQTYGLQGNRFLVNVGCGLMFSTFDFSREESVLKSNGELGYKLSVFDLPVEIGISGVVTNQITLKAQYGYYGNYTQLTEIDIKGRETQLHCNFQVKDISFGIQINAKRVLAPIARLQGEVEFIHSLYTINSGGYSLSKPSHFGSLAFGVYRNFFLGNRNYSSFYLGARIGIPLYEFQSGDYIHIDPMVGVAQINNEGQLFTENLINKLFLIRAGIRYYLPF